VPCTRPGSSRVSMIQPKKLFTGMRSRDMMHPGVVGEKWSS
jgi:hypothetical protein